MATPVLLPAEASCETCVFYEQKSLECRIRAPIYPQMGSVGAKTGVWPQVARDAWCGEYAATLLPKP